MDRRFDEVEHTADAAIRVWGRDLGELFVNAAHGLAAQLADDPDRIPVTVERPVEVQAYDMETLLVTWLGELLYLGEREACVFTEFEAREITPTRLSAVVRGGPLREYRRYVKAVTFNDLQIARTKDGYEARVVFDV